MSILLADIDATCAAFGYSDGKKYHAEPDAIQGLKHLIWILRRDLDNYEYRRHLGRAKVLQTDLVYMLPDYIEDSEYADVLIRLLVILTNPTLLLYRDGPPKDNHGRKVYLELIDILQGYKSAFTRAQFWSALFGQLQKALEIDWALRSEEQTLLIERILVLIRNVLQVPANPEGECRGDNDASLHDQVIWALHQSGMLDLLLFVISSPDEHQFHLHGLEILCLLFREQTAESLADASLQRSVSEKQRDELELIAARRREKQRLQARPPPGRHSRFGGTYVIRNMKSVSDRDVICHQPLERVAAIDFDREKQQQRRSFRHIKEEAQVTRRSAFSVRLCLREYCIEVLRSAYNTLVRQVRRLLERNSRSSNHDDSYLLWAIRFFMEFNRLSGLQLQLVSESLSVQCFHWVLTRMQHDIDMIVSDKKEARLWAKRLHVSLQAFRELLQSLLALQKMQDENARALFDMLLNNVCYVLEYRETILHLLMNYNESHSTKVYLRDVVETANIFIKMMEKFCKDAVVVQDKRRARKHGSKKAKQPTETQPETEEQLENNWAAMAGEMAELLSASELQIAEADLPLPFDAAAEKSIDAQKEDCMIRIHKFLRESKLDQAIALMRAGREVWPENDIFGAMSAAPEDELLLLREIFLHNITTVEKSHGETAEQSDGSDEEENGDIEDNDMVERAFKFEDFSKRLLNPKIVRACTVVLSDWEQIPTKSLKAAVTILYRIAYACSCPAMLYQAKLFRIFQQVFNAARGAHHEELRRLGVFVVRKFVEIAPANPKIYAELLFNKTIKEANELESGYCEAYESGTKGTWTEEQETELRLLFEENQRNPETDKDVIDWILENLIDKTRTRRGVLKKLKEMCLLFKAPTKKSTASNANKNLWRSEEDEELTSLYDQHRMEQDCLQRIVNEFAERRNQQQIIKRMLQLHLIADKSEMLPQKPRKRKSKKKPADSEDENAEDYMEEPQFGDVTTRKASKPKQKKNSGKAAKPPKRKIVRTALDVGTIRVLLEQVDNEKYQAAVDWLKECLNDAAEEAEAPSEEDDGIPLLPLQEVQKEAMEDANFQKVLVALGIQPPIIGMENYWRIPIYLNAADLKLRAQLVGGEEIQLDVGEGDDDAKEEPNANESDEDDDDDDGGGEDDAESEKDYLEEVMQKKREKMNSLMFTKSDDEDAQRAPLKAKKKRQRKTQQRKQSDSSDDNAEAVEKIKQQLDKKKRRPELSSDDESEDSAQTGRAKSEQKQHSAPRTDDLFDQLKAQRAKKVQPSGSAAAVSNSEELDELDFNSEDYRKRLLELGDSDEDQHNENANSAEANSGKRRIRRANVIDSDSDEQEAEEPNDAGAAGGGDDERVVDKTTNQAHIGTDANTSQGLHKKRRRFSHGSAGELVNNGSTTAGNVEADDEDVLFIARRKTTTVEQTSIAISEEQLEQAPTKRRRLAIIDDDDDDDF